MPETSQKGFDTKLWHYLPEPVNSSLNLYCISGIYPPPIKKLPELSLTAEA